MFLLSVQDNNKAYDRHNCGNEVKSLGSAQSERWLYATKLTGLFWVEHYIECISKY